MGEQAEINKNIDFDQAHPQRRRIRKIISPYLQVEQELIRKIKEKREKAEAVTWDWIISEAKRTFNNPNFKGSEGWFWNFKRRWRICRLPRNLAKKYKERAL